MGKGGDRGEEKRVVPPGRAGPEQRGMLFAYEAWVARTPASRLAYYVDVPDALIGDCTYLQNLVIAIESFGSARWEEGTDAAREGFPGH